MTTEELDQRLTALEDKFSDHAHTGIDGQTIMGQYVLFPITTVAPTTKGQNGAVVLYVDSMTSPTVWRLYIRAANTWKYKVIDNAA